MNILGIHYQTWKNRTAVVQALESIRKHYPNAPVRMVSDSGEDFSDLAEKYNCTFDYETKNIFPKGVLLGHPKLGGEFSPEGAKEWLYRLYTTAKSMDSEWLMVFEDDVRIKKPIAHFPSTDAGGILAWQFSPELYDYLSSINEKNEVWGYGMAGGSVINRKFFVDAYETHIDKFDIEHLYNLDERVSGWTDVLLTVFVIFCKGTYGIWKEVRDLACHPHSRLNASIEHNVKDSYTEAQGSLAKF